MELSVIRSSTPKALWCVLTVHGGPVPLPAPAGVPSAPATPATPAGWLFATGVAPAGRPTGRPAYDPAPPLTRPGAAGDPLSRPDLGAAGDLLSRLISHAQRDASPRPRWYLLAEPHESVPPEELKEEMGSALTRHACHQDAIRVLSARTPLTVLRTSRGLLPADRSANTRHPDYYPRLLDRISQLARQGLSAPAITECLRREGFTLAPGREDRISRTAVQRLLREHLRPAVRSRRPAPDRVPGDSPGTDEWWLHDLATELSMPTTTLYSWVRRGWVTAVRKEATPPHRWILRVNPAELGALRARRSRRAGA